MARAHGCGSRRTQSRNPIITAKLTDCCPGDKDPGTRGKGMRMSVDVTSKAPHGFDHIVVVGLGLIGASLAAAISKSDPDVEVFGVDVDSRTCGEAISRGWVANACAPESEAFSDFVKDRADLVVLATPVAAVDDYLRLLRDWDYRGVITDAFHEARISLRRRLRFCLTAAIMPGHPMAGSRRTPASPTAPAPIFSRALTGFCAPTRTRRPSISSVCMSSSRA